jgi:hypothetical protein
MERRGLLEVRAGRGDARQRFRDRIADAAAELPESSHRTTLMRRR